jgi:hypothetical protein
MRRARRAIYEEKKQINSRQGAKHAKVFACKYKINIEVLCDLCASAREKTNKISPRRKARKGDWGKNKQAHEALCGLCASAREKTNKLSPRRQARKGFWYKNKINIEVLCDLCASARKN